MPQWLPDSHGILHLVEPIQTQPGQALRWVSRCGSNGSRVNTMPGGPPTCEKCHRLMIDEWLSAQ